MTAPGRRRNVVSRRFRAGLLGLSLAMAITAGACGGSDDLAETDAADAAVASVTVAPSSSERIESSVGALPVPEPTTTGPTTTAAPTPAEAGTTTSAPNTPPPSSPPAACIVDAVPDIAGLDPFYSQGCKVRNLWVVSAGVVNPEALVKAGALVDALFEHDPLLGRAVVDSGVRLGIIGVDQVTTDMPEYRDLYEAFPEVDWDQRARGLGATPERPLVSAAEENVLCLDLDRYRGEDILLHEFAHVLHLQGYAVVDPDFQPNLEAAYATALANGTWADTYAITNPEEYWAEGVQSYFGRNLGADPADGVHGPIDSAADLAAADPALSAIIDDRLGGLTLPPWCP